MEVALRTNHHVISFPPVTSFFPGCVYLLYCLLLPISCPVVAARIFFDPLPHRRSICDKFLHALLP